MQIWTQIDNHKHRKSVATKKVRSLVMNMKFRNSKFNILCKIAFIFLNKIPTLWSLEVNKAILEQVQVTE